ncbi:putative secreted protein with PEP-CTERM sorting signal [Pseudoduganella flava]|uniref:PEP-CTERM sorting domain-containing protein n=1 Tax=Pseudoduganella flava TaxID=871742 RepID=A0A562PQK5_9BURK|nr:choice-of-anchor J domain-containing protein [Pseudoduganella flava]QGZ37899.1 PEP-CTERM sorting domain-containing protein [Pseudoduganella flava]TWI46735.1 putative secreted protein with PEP-CTERM sorting signal [Pseudoduganella flava]
MKTFLTLFASAALTLSAAAHADTPPTSLIEGFDDVGALSGWTLNGSSAESWFQGNTGIFNAYAGGAASYIASNFDTAAANGAIDNWLITPEFTLSGTTQLTFYTRGSSAEGFGDTLHVAFGTGTAPAGFSDVLLTIGGGTAYPDGWTQYTATVTGTGTGRFGFHYTGSYDTSNYIGIDSVAIAAVPEPSTWLMLGLGLAGVGFAARRNRRAAAGAGLALAALGMSSGALAADTAQEVTQSSAVKESGMVVVRDAESGQLRAPTPAEYRKLVPQAAAAREANLARGVSKAPQVVVNKHGARSLNVEHKAVYSVLTRNADGSVTEACVTGEDAANALIDNQRTAQAKDKHYEAQ